MELITQAEYARRRGVAKSAVAKAVKEGRITLINGKIDPAVADIQWQQNTRARADSGRSGAEAGEVLSLAPEAAPAALDSGALGLETGREKENYLALRTRREQAAVEREERENAKEAGLLVERVAVQRGTFDAFRAFRDAVMSTPPRAAAKVVGLADSREIERVITDELRGALLAAEARLRDQLPQAEGG